MKLSFLVSLAFASTAFAEDWPMWRGPRLDGTSREEKAPVRWSGTENIRWKLALPGVGHASPIVHGNRVFTVACLPDSEERVLLCADATSGKLLWQTTVLKSPLERKHTLNSHASSTPAADGQLVFTAFLDRDQAVVAAHDFAGTQRWLKHVGPFSSMHGFSSSPILYEDKVIVNCDHDGDGYIVALARADGREIWRIERPNKTRSYCVPLIRTLAAKPQMVLSGTKCVTSYDPRDGRLHWIIDGPTEQFVASPVFNDGAGLLFITGGYPDHHLLAVRPDGFGNVTRSHIQWRTTKGVSYVPSPISAGNFFLVVSDSGVAHCFEAATGRLAWAERMGEHHASLVSAAGLVYFLNDEGETHVVRPGATFDLVARNPLPEKIFASPAISGGYLFIRGDRSLFCVGPK